ncbi:MAG: hypothetical protein J6Q88_00065 [Bacteroidales bacterium]|jgi:hypothetical protein|nr:hypothetical protein [Bacteroidales bacterium]
MKRLLIILTGILIPMLASAQAQIETKKVKISDFTQKITKVVLHGNEFYDAILKEEIALRWRISPYEFCTLEEFEELKTNSQYYFLITTLGQFKKETAPGIQFLSLVKGGKGAKKGVGEMLEVASLPYASVEYPSGRELVFLPALLDIIQNHTVKSMDSDFDGYVGMSRNTKNMQQAQQMKIVFFEDEINKEVDRVMRASDERFVMADEDEADQYLIDNAPNTLVSYMVAPTEPVNGSYCYKLLINAETHELYFYRRHKITEKYGVGFLIEDFDYIIKNGEKDK